MFYTLRARGYGGRLVMSAHLDVGAIVRKCSMPKSLTITYIFCIFQRTLDVYEKSSQDIWLNK